eukprot:CAMPEP_0206548674 /NCGR_PEP_ID=MMETSP0325_2-20121206/14016_1 /ASSEMBLY_ACC=CAM_ASM_000347 /TAXON_ID=2866 /ORGANISM="Crypthecodinium cohnii, Strain Seligo" /LENGTH=391 /DNA_ID=CAMNT_0054048183 /DNA_START=72 /DNA_END=1247 /DNA_ORIENTATION=+
MAPTEIAEEDFDAVLQAMEAVDPELDPIWGLLVNDAIAADKGTLDDFEVKFVRKQEDAVEEKIQDDDFEVETPSAKTIEGPESPAVSSGASPSKSGKKPISAVVDKAEVPAENFVLPALPTSGKPEVTRHDVEGCDAFYLENVLTEAECQALIEQSGTSWSFWDDSDEPRVTFRNAWTIEVNHEKIAATIWERVEHLVQPSVAIEDEDDPLYEVDIEGKWVPYGVNPRLLLSRYLNGGHFSPHTDGTTVVDFNRRTFYTCVLFLNSSPWGGETRLYDDAQMQRELKPDAEGRLTGDPKLILDAVPPKPGRMLVFYHRLMHEGVPAAEKYIIRTDILYRRTPEQCTAPEDIEAFAMYQEAQLQAEKGECDLAASLFKKAFKHSEALRKVYRM